MCAMCFWGHVFKKFFRGTQSCFDLCFGGLSTDGEHDFLLSSIQPCGAIGETRPIFVTLPRCIVLHCHVCKGQIIICPIWLAHTLRNGHLGVGIW